MKYFVDTHIFLWSIFSSKKLSKRVKDILLDPKSSILVSAITFWEISLKYQMGKLDLEGVLPEKLPDVAKQAGFEIENLDYKVASSFYRLPKLSNKDPFDRMLAWNSISKNIILLTKDTGFSVYKKYGLNTIW